MTQIQNGIIFRAEKDQMFVLVLPPPCKAQTSAGMILSRFCKEAKESAI